MSFQNKQLRQAALFYGIALGLSIACAFAAPLVGRGILFLTMFTPAIAVLLCRVLMPDGRGFGFAELGLSRLGLRQWPFALIVPFAVLLPGYLMIWSLGIGAYAGPGTDETLLRSGAKIAASLLVGTALGALGEEIGWRGYLLPRLVEVIGVGRAGLLSGFLHGFWHVPLILLTPFYHADLPAQVAVPLFLVAVTLSGPIFAQVRLASGSIVPVALMHNAWNDYWDRFDGVTVATEKGQVALVAGEAGLVTIVMLAIVALFIMRRVSAAPGALAAAHYGRRTWDGTLGILGCRLSARRLEGHDHGCR